MLAESSVVGIDESLEHFFPKEGLRPVGFCDVGPGTLFGGEVTLTVASFDPASAQAD